MSSTAHPYGVPRLALSVVGAIWLVSTQWASGVDYKTDILPLMKKHCWDCHSNEKSVKGSLALDDLDEVRDYQIGKYNIISPGNPEGSSFLDKLKLPPEDRDFMPRKGSPLSKREIEKIEEWIAAGAIVDQKNLSEEESAFLKENGKSPAGEGMASKEGAPPAFHKWTSSDGRVIEARFMGMAGSDKVKLLMKNGKSYEVPLDRLSKESAAKVKELSSKPAEGEK